MHLDLFTLVNIVVPVQIKKTLGICADFNFYEILHNPLKYSFFHFSNH